MGKGMSQLPVDVTINNGLVDLLNQFKYMGGVLSSDIKLDAEVAARQGRGLGVFTQFKCIWGNKHFKLSTKVQVFDTFVVLHFLYGSETWNLMQTHKKRLEMAYSNYLRRMLGMKVTNQHCLIHI